MNLRCIHAPSRFVCPMDEPPPTTGGFPGAGSPGAPMTSGSTALPPADFPESVLCVVSCCVVLCCVAQSVTRINIFVVAIRREVRTQKRAKKHRALILAPKEVFVYIRGLVVCVTELSRGCCYIQGKTKKPTPPATPPPKNASRRKSERKKCEDDRAKRLCMNPFCWCNLFCYNACQCYVSSQIQEEEASSSAGTTPTSSPF